MERIIGLVDAPFTPMKPNGDINLEPIPAYAAMLAKNGLVGVFINGSSGEGYMLTTEERKALAEAWVKAVPAGYNGPLKLDTELRQIKTLNFVVEYGKDITQKVHA